MKWNLTTSLEFVACINRIKRDTECRERMKDFLLVISLGCSCKPGVGNLFQLEGHTASWATFQGPHASGGQARWENGQCNRYKCYLCTVGYTPLSVSHGDKQYASSQFEDVFQPG